MIDRHQLGNWALALSVIMSAMANPACVTSTRDQLVDEDGGVLDFRNTPPKPGLVPETVEQIARSRFVALPPSEARAASAGFLIDAAGHRMGLIVATDATWSVASGEAPFAYQLTEQAYQLLSGPGLSIEDGKVLASDGRLWALEAHSSGYATVIPE